MLTRQRRAVDRQGTVLRALTQPSVLLDQDAAGSALAQTQSAPSTVPTAVAVAAAATTAAAAATAMAVAAADVAGPLSISTTAVAAAAEGIAAIGGKSGCASPRCRKCRCFRGGICSQCLMERRARQQAAVSAHAHPGMAGVDDMETD